MPYSDEDLTFMGVTPRMREVTADVFAARRRVAPAAEWVIATPIGEPGPERFFIEMDPIDLTVTGRDGD